MSIKDVIVEQQKDMLDKDYVEALEHIQDVSELPKRVTKQLFKDAYISHKRKG